MAALYLLRKGRADPLLVKLERAHKSRAAAHPRPGVDGIRGAVLPCDRLLRADGHRQAIHQDVQRWRAARLGDLAGREPELGAGVGLPRTTCCDQLLSAPRACAAGCWPGLQHGEREVVRKRAACLGQPGT